MNDVVIAAAGLTAVALALVTMQQGEARLRSLAPPGQRGAVRKQFFSVVGSRPLIVTSVLGSAVVGGMLMRSAAAGVVVAVMASFSYVSFDRARRRRAEARLRAAVVELCGAMSSELAAGRSPADALTAACDAPPLQPLLSGTLVATGIGASVPEGLMAASAVPGARALRLLAACWSVAGDNGAGLAAGLRRLGDALRSEEAARREILAQVAAARATVQLLAALPVVALALGASIGSDPVRVLFHTPVGAGCLAVGLAFTAAGLIWSDRLLRAAEQRV